MKVDELLKRLETVKIDERYKIAEYLVRKLGVKNSVPLSYYIMMKDRKIYDIPSYRKLLKSGRISPDNAYVYVLVRNVYYPASYYFPFLVDSYLLLYAYLSKLGLEERLHHTVGLEDLYHVAPATGLKYISTVISYLDNSHVVVEITDIDYASNNMNLPTLIRDIIGTKYIDDHKVEDIVSQLESQKLFAGHDIGEAWRIFNRYYENNDTSLTKEVEAIRDAYNRIFQPFRVVYDTDTKRFISA
jgi:hypothetical protein